MAAPSRLLLLLLTIGFERAMAHDFQSNITHSSANSTYGVDISSPISETTFSCLIGDGFTFAIVRAYESSGTPDKNAPATIANARAAGMKYVDVYLFPCPKCSKTASQQVEEMMQSLKVQITEWFGWILRAQNTGLDQHQPINSSSKIS
eukprot:Em0015g262a